MIFLFIVAFFSAFIYFLSQKFNSKIITGGAIFLLFFVFGSFVPISVSSKALLMRLFSNMTPAVLFLFVLDFNPKTFFHGEVGCSCKMGAKRYWLIVLLSFAVTLFVQFIVLYGGLEPIVLYASLLSVLLGVIASYTPLRYVNGTAEIATTMLYLLAALAGITVATF